VRESISRIATMCRMKSRCRNIFHDDDNDVDGVTEDKNGDNDDDNEDDNDDDNDDDDSIGGVHD